MYKALHLSPMIPSYNIKETAAFFSDILNFAFFMNEANYVIMVKDDLMIHILNAGDIGEMEFIWRLTTLTGCGKK
jgi:hypothetical protein